MTTPIDNNDPYLNKKFNAIKRAFGLIDNQFSDNSKEEVKAIINKVYEEGFGDGVDSEIIERELVRKRRKE